MFVVVDAFFFLLSSSSLLPFLYLYFLKRWMANLRCLYSDEKRERGGMCGLKDIPRLYKARKRLAGRIKRRQANFSCAQAVRNDMIMAHKKEGEEKKTARLNLTHRRRSKCRDGTQISRWCKIVHIHEQFSVVHRR